jgi:hypothetical protein
LIGFVFMLTRLAAVLSRADRILVQAAARDAAVTVDRTDQWIDLNSSMSALSYLTN